MPGQQALEGVGRFQQHIDHGRCGLELVAAQFVEQALHLVRELGHVFETKGGGTALDRVGAAKDRIELFVIDRFKVEVEQLLLHLF